MNKKYLTTSELAKMLGISRIAVFKRIKNGDIKASKIGRNYAIDKKDLGGIADIKTAKPNKKTIDEAVKKTIEEYGETLRLLGKE